MDNLKIMNRWEVRDTFKIRVIISMCGEQERGVNQAQIMIQRSLEKNKNN